MTYRVYTALIASLSLVALMLAANETLARPAAAHGGFSSARSMFHPRVAHSLSRYRRNNVETFWPADGGFYGPSTGEPTADATHPASGDVHYSYDVPWDWAHRYPPAVTPSDRPYVPSCPTETMRFPGRDGNEQTVNVTRCY